MPQRPVLTITSALMLGVGCVTPLGGTVGAEPPPATNAESEKPRSSEQAAPTGPPAIIEGFRAAHFGESEEQVRQSIKKDFPSATSKLKVATNPGEKTTVLLLPVRDLLPGTGTAQVSYILGYKSKKLIQVNVIWTSEGTEESDQAVVATANTLRNHFAGENYKRDSVVANRQVAEQTIVVFRAMDEQGRTVLVVLSGAGAAARKEAKGATPQALTLELSYIADATHPDVFQIGKGQF